MRSLRARYARPFALVALAALTGVLASGCGAAGPAGRPGAADQKPEKAHIVVGALPVADSAPLFIAIHQGFFHQAGLTVTPEIIQGSPSATPSLVTGTMDFTLLNYVSTFEIEQNSGIDFRLVANASQAAPGLFDLLVPKGSPITSPADLKGKSIAAPEASGAIANLATDATLKAHGASPDQVRYVAVPFPDMQAALARGEVAAAWVTEPFATAIKAAIGARVLADTMTGAMAGFPVSGWGTTAQYVRRYPRTVAAFQRAMARAQRLAATDRTLVRQTLPTYTSIKPGLAAAMALGAYPATLSVARLQRAADLMLQFGFLRHRLTVAPMVLPEP